ncbi:alpha-L-rhamnosidase-like protein [Pedobacter metabolipauper]|uniref:Alpha-L-rhamnosidase-like protein n=2 Tax=Pedobacter metabolipauper TaxID=425513 RepID=A0A4R6ST26_9SPHI|nr:alpha-L-rhamnosidase-like protein [Pedobacter metabolipauper]
MFKLSTGIASLNLLMTKKKTRLLFLLTTIIYSNLLFCPVASAQKIVYKPVSGTLSGTPVPLSPDPLINMKWASPKATDELEYYHLRPVSFTTASARSFDTKNFKIKNEVVVNGEGDLMFDFGRVSAGWLEFESDDLTDSVLMSISEYNEPAIVNIGTAHPFKTASVVKDGNTYRIHLNNLWYEGVRFGWIHVVSHKKQWHLKNLRLVCQIKPTNYNGSFACSDPELTKIWYTGAYTVKLNLLKDYFGAILMDRSDRHSWTGDAFPAQAASMVAFGNFDFVKKNIHNTANLSNDIASYALYWVLSLVDYVNYTGDTDLAKYYLDNAGKKLEHAYGHFGKSPRIAFYGWDERLGGGFENPNAEAQNAYSMLSIRAWSEFGKLMRTIGNLKEADKYEGYATEKIQSLRKENAWLSTFGLHAAADAINTNLTTPEENNILFNKNFTDRVNRISYSSFNEWFIISAMAKSQRFDEAISAIKDSWGGQIRYGGTTFFEVFRPQWNEILTTNDAPPNNQAGYTSFTHPWSAGIVKWLSEEILGIKPLEPGFKSFSIVPHLGRSLTSVNGGIPTEKGLISASFDTKSGISRVKVPAGTMAKTIALPIGKNVPSSLKINGKTTAISIEHGENEDFLILNNLEPGEYLFEVKYKKQVKQIALKNTPWIYKVHGIGQDSTTRGNWKGTYGGDGSILFNLYKKGQHVEKLPAYLGKIKLSRYADVHRDVQDPNIALLQDSARTNDFGAIATKNYNVCEQSMTIDLPVTDNGTHRVSLYFLDQDNVGRRSAIEIFDMNTLNLIGPMIYVKNYSKGKYVSFDVQGPIRLRINQVRGINVSLSGIFFDKIK